MPTIRELSNTELLLKYDKLNDYLELVKKEVKRRGLRKSLSEHLSSWFDPDEVSVTAPRPSHISTSIKKTSLPPGVMEVVSDSDSDPSAPKAPLKLKVSRGGSKSKSKAKIKAKKAATPPKPPSAAKPKKREVEKATVAEIKAVLTRNGVKFKSRDTKKVLLEIAAKHNLIRTISYYHDKNSKS